MVSKRSSAAGADIEEVARLSWRASYIYAACAAGTVHGALPSRRAAAPLVARCRCHTCVSTSWPLTILVVVPLWQHENPVRSTSEVFSPQLRGVKTCRKLLRILCPSKIPLGLLTHHKLTSIRYWQKSGDENLGPFSRRPKTQISREHSL